MSGECPHCSAPGPIEGSDWQAALHWIVRRLPTGHEDLSFAASLLYQSIERPGLTERQAKYAKRLLERVRAELPEGRGAGPVDLATVRTAGKA